MAIPSRQIGWGTESNLLWQILKQLNKLTSVLFGLKPNYKVFTALLNQTEEEAPEVIVLQNNTGLEFTTNRGSTGAYTINFTGYVLDQSKVVILMGPYSRFLNLPSLLSAYLYDDNTVFINTTEVATLTEVDGILKNTSIEIRVYS